MFLTNFKWNYYNVPFGFGYACFMCRLYSIYTVTVYLKTAMYLAWDKVWLFFSEDRLATLWNSRAHFTQVKLHLLFGWNFKFLQILLFIQSTVA